MFYRIYFWLVVDQPLWKIMEFVSWGYFSQYMEKNKMFQTTNQYWNLYLEKSGQVVNAPTAQVGPHPLHAGRWPLTTGSKRNTVLLLLPQHFLLPQPLLLLVIVFLLPSLHRFQAVLLRSFWALRSGEPATFTVLGTLTAQGMLHWTWALELGPLQRPLWYIFNDLHRRKILQARSV